MEAARRIRKLLGGAMRQVGVVAAAGIVALETMISRLAQDHANARKLALGLARIPGIKIHPDSLPTNLVFFEVDVESQAELSRRLDERGVKVLPRVPRWRMVTHNDITSEDIDYTLDVFETAVRELAVA
jgi:threonine aldolase